MNDGRKVDIIEVNISHQKRYAVTMIWFDDLASYYNFFILRFFLIIIIIAFLCCVLLLLVLFFLLFVLFVRRMPSLFFNSHKLSLMEEMIKSESKKEWERVISF